MIRLLLPCANDLAEIVDALLASADAVEARSPEIARARRTLANKLGDALDTLPKPTTREDHDTVTRNWIPA